MISKSSPWNCTMSISCGNSPLHHHDPFDRLLIAQAKAEQMRLVSADSQFAPYLVDVLW
jgi:PIN domain nuclease of toxin-antitoxin system